MNNWTTLVLLGLFSILFHSCTERPCDCNLIYKDKDTHLYYSRETDKIFSGKCKELYGSGDTKYMVKYNEGYKVSVVYYYESGEINYEEEYDKTGIFTSGVTYYIDGKTSTEETFNLSNKYLSRKGYYENGQIKFQEIINSDTLTFKSFQENGTPTFEKQALINIDWDNFLESGEPLSNSEICTIDRKGQPFKGYLTYAKKYYENGNPMYHLEFEENHITNLSYNFDFIKNDQNEFFNLRQYGNTPMLYLIIITGNIKNTYRDGFPKPGSKVFFDNGKTSFESIEPIRCSILNGDRTIVGIHYNENGNIFGLSVKYKELTISFENLYYFDYKSNFWEPNQFDLDLNSNNNDLTNLDQLCN